MKLKSKICNNCFAVMIWDDVNKRFRCVLCGNAEPSKKELKGTLHDYIN